MYTTRSIAKRLRWRALLLLSPLPFTLPTTGWFGSFGALWLRYVSILTSGPLRLINITNEINIGTRRNSKRELGDPFGMCYGEVAFIYNVHPNENICVAS